MLFLGDDAWQVPGGPDGAGQANLYGYQEAQRRRRMWLIGGIGAGTAVAVAIIVVVASSMGGSSGATAADQTRVTTPPSPTTPATAPAAAPASPTAAASPTVSATPPASVLSDGQSGLSYSQLATPWQAGCPSDLASAFSWTAGEAAVAGQINGGQTTWYGEACSGPLPAQYNYTGASDLENTATNVASTLGNAYYTALAHTSSPVLSQPVSVSGHPGWEIEYQLTYTNAAAQGATWTTEEGAVDGGGHRHREHPGGVLRVGAEHPRGDHRELARLFAPAQRGAQPERVARRRRLPRGRRATPGDCRALTSNFAG